jgi:acyl-CoA hydrolase
LDAKPVSASRVELSHMMGAQDANTLGNVHGGIIMKHVDETGALAAIRHAQLPCVTVFIDSMTFMHPIHLGNVVTFRAEVSYVGRTSIETFVTVTAENPLTGETWLSNTAFVVYVAIDAEGRPAPVPGLICETDAEKRRNAEGEARQRYRKRVQAERERLA